MLAQSNPFNQALNLSYGYTSQDAQGLAQYLVEQKHQRIFNSKDLKSMGEEQKNVQATFGLYEQQINSQIFCFAYKQTYNSFSVSFIFYIPDRLRIVVSESLSIALSHLKQYNLTIRKSNCDCQQNSLLNLIALQNIELMIKRESLKVEDEPISLDSINNILKVKKKYAQYYLHIVLKKYKLKVWAQSDIEDKFQILKKLRPISRSQFTEIVGTQKNISVQYTALLKYALERGDNDLIQMVCKAGLCYNDLAFICKNSIKRITELEGLFHSKCGFKYNFNGKTLQKFIRQPKKDYFQQKKQQFYLPKQMKEDFEHLLMASINNLITSIKSAAGSNTQINPNAFQQILTKGIGSIPIVGDKIASIFKAAFSKFNVMKIKEISKYFYSNERSDFLVSSYIEAIFNNFSGQIETPQISFVKYGIASTTQFVDQIFRNVGDLPSKAYEYNGKNYSISWNILSAKYTQNFFAFLLNDNQRRYLSIDMKSSVKRLHNYTDESVRDSYFSLKDLKKIEREWKQQISQQANSDEDLDTKQVFSRILAYTAIADKDSKNLSFRIFPEKNIQKQDYSIFYCNKKQNTFGFKRIQAVKSLFISYQECIYISFFSTQKVKRHDQNTDTNQQKKETRLKKCTKKLCYCFKQNQNEVKQNEIQLFFNYMYDNLYENRADTQDSSLYSLQHILGKSILSHKRKPRIVIIGKNKGAQMSQLLAQFIWDYFYDKKVDIDKLYIFEDQRDLGESYQMLVNEKEGQKKKLGIKNYLKNLFHFSSQTKDYSVYQQARQFLKYNQEKPLQKLLKQQMHIISYRPSLLTQIIQSNLINKKDLVKLLVQRGIDLNLQDSYTQLSSSCPQLILIIIAIGFIIANFYAIKPLLLWCPNNPCCTTQCDQNNCQGYSDAVRNASLWCDCQSHPQCCDHQLGPNQVCQCNECGNFCLNTLCTSSIGFLGFMAYGLPESLFFLFLGYLFEKMERYFPKLYDILCQSICFPHQTIRGGRMRPIHYAFQKGDIQLVKYLIDSGADYHNNLRYWRESPSVLSFAANSGNLNLVKYLVQQYAITDYKNVVLYGNQTIKLSQEKSSSSVLNFYGIRYSQIVRYLINKGLNPNHKLKILSNNKTVTESSMIARNYSLMRFLISKGGKIPVQYNCFSRYAQSVKKLEIQRKTIFHLSSELSEIMKKQRSVIMADPYLLGYLLCIVWRQSIVQKQRQIFEDQLTKIFQQGFAQTKNTYLYLHCFIDQISSESISLLNQLSVQEEIFLQDENVSANMIEINNKKKQSIVQDSQKIKQSLKNLLIQLKQPDLFQGYYENIKRVYCNEKIEKYSQLQQPFRTGIQVFSLLYKAEGIQTCNAEKNYKECQELLKKCVSTVKKSKKLNIQMQLKYVDYYDLELCLAEKILIKKNVKKILKKDLSSEAQRFSNLISQFPKFHVANLKRIYIQTITSQNKNQKENKNFKNELQILSKSIFSINGQSIQIKILNVITPQSQTFQNNISKADFVKSVQSNLVVNWRKLRDTVTSLLTQSTEQYISKIKSLLWKKKIITKGDKEFTIQKLMIEIHSASSTILNSLILCWTNRLIPKDKSSQLFSGIYQIIEKISSVQETINCQFFIGFNHLNHLNGEHSQSVVWLQNDLQLICSCLEQLKQYYINYIQLVVSDYHRSKSPRYLTIFRNYRAKELDTNSSVVVYTDVKEQQISYTLNANIKKHLTISKPTQENIYTSSYSMVVLPQNGPNRVFYKYNPCAPGIQYAVNILYNIIHSRGNESAQSITPNTSVIVVSQFLQNQEGRTLKKDVKVSEKKQSLFTEQEIRQPLMGSKNLKNQFTSAYYVASQGIEGQLLSKVIEKKDVRQSIDLENFSTLFITSLLILPRDARPQNFIAQIVKDSAGQAIKTKLFPIDNQLSFAKFELSKNKSQGGKLYSDAINVLFLLPQMNEPVHESFYQFFKNITTPEKTMEQWLTKLEEKNNYYDNWHKSMKGVDPHSVQVKGKYIDQLKTKLPQGQSVRMFKRLKKISDTIVSNINPTHNDIFSIINPNVAAFYKENCNSQRILDAFRTINSATIKTGIGNKSVEFLLKQLFSVDERISNKSTKMVSSSRVEGYEKQLNSSIKKQREILSEFLKGNYKQSKIIGYNNKDGSIAQYIRNLPYEKFLDTLKQTCKILKTGKIDKKKIAFSLNNLQQLKENIKQITVSSIFTIPIYNQQDQNLDGSPVTLLEIFASNSFYQAQLRKALSSLLSYKTQKQKSFQKYTLGSISKNLIPLFIQNYIDCENSEEIFQSILQLKPKFSVLNHWIKNQVQKSLAVYLLQKQKFNLLLILLKKVQKYSLSQGRILESDSLSQIDTKFKQLSLVQYQIPEDNKAIQQIRYLAKRNKLVNISEIVYRNKKLFKDGVNILIQDIEIIELSSLFYKYTQFQLSIKQCYAQNIQQISFISKNKFDLVNGNSMLQTIIQQVICGNKQAEIDFEIFNKFSDKINPTQFVNCTLRADGNSALHLAVLANNAYLVEKLLKWKNLNPNVLNSDLKRPIDLLVSKAALSQSWYKKLKSISLKKDQLQMLFGLDLRQMKEDQLSLFFRKQSKQSIRKTSKAQKLSLSTVHKPKDSFFMSYENENASTAYNDQKYQYTDKDIIYILKYLFRNKYIISVIDPRRDLDINLQVVHRLKFILIPYNFYNYHWVMIGLRLLTIEEKKQLKIEKKGFSIEDGNQYIFFIKDSIYDRKRESAIISEIKKRFQNKNIKILINALSGSQQLDSTSCGIFTIENMRIFADYSSQKGLMMLLTNFERLSFCTQKRAMQLRIQYKQCYENGIFQQENQRKQIRQQNKDKLQHLAKALYHESKEIFLVQEDDKNEEPGQLLQYLYLGTDAYSPRKFKFMLSISLLKIDKIKQVLTRLNIKFQELKCYRKVVLQIDGQCRIINSLIKKQLEQAERYQRMRQQLKKFQK